MRQTLFAPTLENMVNEFFNRPLHDVVDEKKHKYTHPAANIIKKESEYIVTLAVPGIKKEDIKLNIEKDSLTIKSQLEDNDERNFRLREFNYSNFERSFKLSDDADLDKVSAKVEHGILTIQIPVLENAGPRKVEIL